MNYLKKLIMVTWNSLLVVFSELKNPVAFLDSVKRREILIEEAQNKQKEFTRYKKKRKRNKSEKKNIG